MYQPSKKAVEEVQYFVERKKKNLRANQQI
jgi:hypothetical protein